MSKEFKAKSGYEQSHWNTLTKAKVRFKYEPYKLEYLTHPHGAWCTTCDQRAGVVVRRRYVPDWVSEDDQLIVESKGKFTPSDRTKMLAVIAAHPEKDIRMLFMRDNWLTRKKLEKYSDWCTKHNIKYAIGEFPKEWIKDFKRHQIQVDGIGRRSKRKGISG